MVGKSGKWLVLLPLPLVVAGTAFAQSAWDRIDSRPPAAQHGALFEATRDGFFYLDEKLDKSTSNGGQPIAKFKTGQSFCTYGGSEEKGWYVFARPNGKSMFASPLAGFRQLDHNGCKEIADAAPVTAADYAAAAAAMKVANSHAAPPVATGTIIGWIAAALGVAAVVTFAVSVGKGMKEKRTPLSAMTHEAGVKLLHKNVALFAEKLQRGASGPERARLLDEYRKDLIAYGCTQLPNGDFKPVPRQSTREKVLAARVAVKARQHAIDANIARNRKGATVPTLNTNPQGWEIELADWFADLVTFEVNQSLFPKQEAATPFGPETATGPDNHPAAPDLAYKPNV